MLNISAMDAGSFWRENGQSKDKDSRDGLGMISIEYEVTLLKLRSL